MEFSGTILRQTRWLRALSQAELAERAQLSERNVVKLELGRQQPRPATVRRLSKALGVDPSTFFVVIGPGQGKTQAVLDALAGLAASGVARVTVITPEPEAEPGKAAA